ncbi:MAG: hypothetical protein GF320_00305, partial [Armatimonadia bacterium]|nr:hypothetical protein [Armatimonadia bacterium]
TEYRARVAEVLRLVLLIAAPAVVLTALHAPALVRVLFERGEFGPADTLFTSGIVRVLVWQMFLAAATGVYAQAYLAVEDSRLVSVVRVAGHLASTVTYVLLFQYFGLNAILSGDILAPALALAIFAGMASRRIGGERPAGLGRFLLSLAGANLVMAAAILAMLRIWPAPPSPSPLTAEGPWLAGQVIVALVVYLLGARLLMPTEWRTLSQRLRRR